MRLFKLSPSGRRFLERSMRLYPEAAEMELEEENQEIRELSSRFKRHSLIRLPADLLRVVRWKWPPTPASSIEGSSRKVRQLTARAFECASRGSLESAIDTLDDLKGIGPPMASAILMFFDPNRFTVMDVNAWLSLVHLRAIDPFECGWSHSSDYRKYLEACLAVKRQFHHSLRNTDRALWTFGARRGQLPRR